MCMSTSWGMDILGISDHVHVHLAANELTTSVSLQQKVQLWKKCLAEGFDNPVFSTYKINVELEELVWRVAYQHNKEK